MLFRSICPPAHDPALEYDAHAFAHRRPNAVSAESGIDFSDYRRCHTLHTKERRARRNPAPWAMHDETLRELLLVFLEHRFYIRPEPGDAQDTRLEHIEAAAKAVGAREQVRLRKYLKAYEHAPRRVGVQLLNTDTQVALTQRGIAQIIAALCYLYFRLGYASTDCAEVLSLKPPHVRQMLARLAHTWERFVAPHAPDRGLPVLRGHAARARLGNRTRYRAGVGEKYEVRQRLYRVSAPLKLGGRKPVARRNGLG